MCTTAQLLPGEMTVAWDGDTAIVVFNHDGSFHALEDRCSHEDYELSTGSFDPATGSIECVLHGARFDVHDGRALCGPAYEPARPPSPGSTACAARACCRARPSPLPC